jgi:hypothetical protein
MLLLMKRKLHAIGTDLSHKLLQELAILRREITKLRIYVLMLNLK